MDIHLKIQLLTLEHSTFFYYFSNFSLTASRKILNLASILSQLSKDLPKELTGKLYRFQNFASLSTECWSVNEFLEIASKGDCFDKPTMHKVFDCLDFRIHEENDGSLEEALIISLKDIIENSKNTPLHISQYIESLVLQVDSKAVLKFMIDEEIRFCDQEDGTKSSLAAAAEIFGIPLMVISSKPNLPIYPIFPLHCDSSRPVFIFFNGENQTYHPLVKKKSIANETTSVTYRCYCGQKQKDSEKRKKNCFQNFTCKCLKNNETCSKLCRCTNCGNDKTETATLKRRKRIPHIQSGAHTITSLQYLLNMKEPPNEPMVSEMQHFILEATLHFLSIDSLILNQETGDVAEALYQEILKIHAEIVFEDATSPICHSLKISLSLIKKWVSARQKKKCLIKQFFEKNNL